jgi:hypothetical protein
LDNRPQISEAWRLIRMVLLYNPICEFGRV